MKILKTLIVIVISSIIIPVYTGRNNCFAQSGPWEHSVYRATSTDGLNFIKDTTLLFFPASVPGAVKDTNETIFIYYVYMESPSVNETLMVATSTDGANFTAPQAINVTGSSVIKKVDPNPVLLPDGRIRLYYLDLGTQPSKYIHSAVSMDGFNFTEESGIRFTKDGITDPDVFMVNDSLWVMFVSMGTTLVRAISADGLTFTEDTTFNWNNGGVCSTFLFSGGIFRTYYCGQGGIKSATSTDGYNLTFEPGVRIQAGANESICDPTLVHQMTDSTYIMYYKTAPLTTGFGENINCCSNPDLYLFQDNNLIILQFNYLPKENYTLKIFDVTGKLVYSYNNISTSPIKIEKNNFRSGIYLYKFFNAMDMVSVGKFYVE